MISSLCVFCGSALGVQESYAQISRDVGLYCANNSIELVYGGGHAGLMGVSADACLSSGGQVTGIIPELLKDKEIAHSGLSKLYITQDMHERQAMMADLSDAFLVLPGGLGTLAEFFEVLTWKQIGLHNKPIIIFDTQERYWMPLLTMIQKISEQKFMRQSCEDLFKVIFSIEDLDASLPKER